MDADADGVSGTRDLGWLFWWGRQGVAWKFRENIERLIGRGKREKRWYELVSKRCSFLLDS